MYSHPSTQERPVMGCVERSNENSNLLKFD